MRRFFLRFLRSLALAAVLALLYFFFFQQRLIYYPPHSSPEEIAAFTESGGVRLDYVTNQGKQTAWLQFARQKRAPERFWIICGGNATAALQLADLQRNFDLQNDALLLLDYPGYGVSQGKPSPKTILENLQTAVPLATAATGFPLNDLPSRGIVFGHSLGCAVSLLGAEMYGIKRAVLLAPFTSTMEMSKVVLHVPLGWLVRHRFDNHAELKKLAERGGHAWIFHGDRDEAIPTRMGRQLAQESGGAVTYLEVANGWHNDLFEKASVEIAQAMREARN